MIIVTSFITSMPEDLGMSAIITHQKVFEDKDATGLDVALDDFEVHTHVHWFEQIKYFRHMLYREQHQGHFQQRNLKLLPP